MGYRSTFITDETSLKLPDWFYDKWNQIVYFNEAHTLPIASKQEGKCYGMWEGLPYDIQKVIQEDKADADWRSVQLMFLHEDGLYTKYEIFADRIEDERGANILP